MTETRSGANGSASDDDLPLLLMATDTASTKLPDRPATIMS
ncbi:hypothetical protein [Acetobacter senegalensis]|nr:hypothetical protein [Acetobacter senegalensis]